MDARGSADVRSHDAPARASTVHLLGGLYVIQDGRHREVPEGSKRLLAFLALRRGCADRRYTAGTLWPSVDDRRAAGNLRSALWRLRCADIDVLETDKRSIGLRPGVVVDVHEAADWAARLIARNPQPGDLSLGRPLLHALDLLPGCYDDWAIIERERLRQRVLHALEALSRALAAVGRFGEAVDAALTAVSVDPLRESAQRVLLEAHLAESNLSEARRDFLAYRELARRELGAEPSAELAALVRWNQSGGRAGHRAAVAVSA